MSLLLNILVIVHKASTTRIQFLLEDTPLLTDSKFLQQLPICLTDKSMLTMEMLRGFCLIVYLPHAMGQLSIVYAALIAEIVDSGGIRLRSKEFTWTR